MEALDKIRSGKAKIGIIGLGYVGLPLAQAFTVKGISTIGFDIDEKKIKMINSNNSYIKHISDESIKEMHNQGIFSVTNDFSKISSVDVIIICVPTPLSKHREPDLGPVLSTGRSISPHLVKDQLIVLESSTYPGTTDTELKNVLEESGLRADKDFYLAYSPEREDPGNEKYSTASIPKVVGADSELALELVTALYETVITKVISVGSSRTAEAVKLTENIFRSVNIALANELKVIFDSMDIDIWDVIDGAATKPFGYMPFYPGPGLGGHCIPIDPFYLTYKAREHDVPTRFIELAGEINTHMPQLVVAKTTKSLSAFSMKAINGSKILIIGMAYKKNVDDMRESPSLVLTELLESDGAEVHYHDPFVHEIPNTRDHFNLAGRRSVELSPEIIAGFDVVLISTDHDQINYSLLSEHARLIVDTRNVMKSYPGKARVIKA